MISELIAWGDWQEMEGAWLADRLPRESGLYRVRREGREMPDYIGQTGMGLKRRVGMLRGVYKNAMPYRDPHTAGPALWALRCRDTCTFEVSVMAYGGPAPKRKGLEALAIALHRQRWGRSPTCNFGRMPEGYRMSTANNARLRDSGRRSRGGPIEELDASHRSGLDPAGPLEGDVEGLGWCGHAWSDWRPIADARSDARDAAFVARVVSST